MIWGVDRRGDSNPGLLLYSNKNLETCAHLGLLQFHLFIDALSTPCSLLAHWRTARRKNECFNAAEGSQHRSNSTSSLHGSGGPLRIVLQCRTTLAWLWLQKVEKSRSWDRYITTGNYIWVWSEKNGWKRLTEYRTPNRFGWTFGFVYFSCYLKTVYTDDQTPSTSSQHLNRGCQPTRPIVICPFSLNTPSSTFIVR